MLPIRLFVFRTSGEQQAFTLAYYQSRQPGATEESVAAAHAAEGSPGEWHTVETREFTAGVDRDIKRAMLVPSPGAMGFASDPAEEPAARASVAVKSWTFKDDGGNPVPVSKEGYLTLPGKVAQVLDVVLFERLYGGSEDLPFLKASIDSARSSEASAPKSAPPS